MLNNQIQESGVMVSVRCATYNHVNYIRQCLDGFVMQKTNFRFEVIVHDDASTDGTTDIVREYAERYPEIIKPMFEKTNQYSVDVKNMNRRINANLTGKYIAICEGDDYWTDPFKLQKQVGFLESHPDYSMCYHAVNYIQNGKKIGNDRSSSKEYDVSFEQMLRGGGYFCSTNSLCFRRSIYNICPKYREIAIAGDYPLQIQMILSGRVHYFPEIMGCYRVADNGGWSSKSSNMKIHMSRYLNLISWMKELDKETGGKYNSRIYLHICGFMFDHMKKGEYPCCEYQKFLDEIELTKLPIVKVYKYFKFWVYSKFKQYNLL